jgi:hypothetical protein
MYARRLDSLRLARAVMNSKALFVRSEAVAALAHTEADRLLCGERRRSELMAHFRSVPNSALNS